MSYNALLISLSNKIALSGALILLCLLAKAQDTTKTVLPEPPTQELKVDRGTVTGDTKAAEITQDSLAELHSPKKATIMSAILPGAGQIYNKKWWKVPILYGGFAVAGYFLYDNLEHINLYKDAYIAATDGDPSTDNTTGYTNSELLDRSGLKPKKGFFWVIWHPNLVQSEVAVL